MKRVLFVCLGNICRSAAAEGVFRQLSAPYGQEIFIDSAGTSDWHLGRPPYGPMIEAAAARGVDLSDLRARQFGAADFAAFDLIIAMDADNLADIEQLRPIGDHTRVRLFLDFAPETVASEVPDPYYTRDFDRALDLIEAASRGLLVQFR